MQLKTKGKEANSLGKQLVEAEARAVTAERNWNHSDVRFSVNVCVHLIHGLEFRQGQLRTAHTENANLQKSESKLKRELESVKVPLY